MVKDSMRSFKHLYLFLAFLSFTFFLVEGYLFINALHPFISNNIYYYNIIFYYWNSLLSIYISSSVASFVSALFFVVAYLDVRSGHSVDKIRLIGCVLQISALAPLTLFQERDFLFFFSLAFILTLVGLFIVFMVMQERTPTERWKRRDIVSLLVAIGLCLAITFSSAQEGYKRIVLSPLDYSNYNFGWGIDIPDNWVGSTDAHFPFMASFHPEAFDNVTLIIGVGPSAVTNLESLINERLKLLENGSHSDVNLTILSHGERTVDGVDGYEILYEAREEIDNNVSISRVKNVFAIKDGKLVDIVYTAPTAYFSIFEVEVEKSIDSLTIV